MVAELGLELGSLECKMDSGFWGADLGSDPIPLAGAARPGLGPPPYPQPPRGQSQDLDGRLGGLKHLPKDKLRKHCTEWVGGLGEWVGVLVSQESWTEVQRAGWVQGIGVV